MISKIRKLVDLTTGKEITAEEFADLLDQQLEENKRELRYISYDFGRKQELIEQNEELYKISCRIKDSVTA